MGTRGWQRGDRLLDTYDVLDVVHSGGMGLVHRVRHLNWQIDLAVKTPRPQLMATASGRSRFEAEANTWVGLGLHPHVVSCVYVRRIDELPCVFAEWVGGGSLAAAVRAGRFYADDPVESVITILDIAVQAAWGLAHAHEHAVVHQDVKPANIMIEVDGTAKITDFGLAKARVAAGEDVRDRPADAVLASYGGLTPAYCSPEQAEAAAGRPLRLTPATDVWSWGLCVLEMFVGRPPCRYGQSAPEVFQEFLAAGPADSRLPPMPPGVVELLWRCFTPSPESRPSRIAELADVVAEVYAEVAGSAYPRTRPSAASLLADNLSNQALSLLDLGRDEEAAGLWRRAADVDPQNPHVVYNWGLRGWRTGGKTDEELVADLERARALRGDAWHHDHLLGFVHLERGDEAAARDALADTPDQPEVVQARTALDHRAPVPSPLVLDGFPGEPSALALDAKGAVALVGSDGGAVVVWSATHGTRRLPGGFSAVTAVAVSADGRRGLVVHADATVAVWDTVSGDLLHQFRLEVTDVGSAALDATGRTAAVASREGTVLVLDLHTGEWLLDVTVDPEPRAVVLDDEGTTVVVAAGGSMDHHLFTWDVATGRPGPCLVRRRSGELTGIDRMVLSRDGSRALLAYWQGPLRVWDAHTGHVVSEAPNTIPSHELLSLSRDGTVVVSAARTLRIWETGSGRCLRSIDVAPDELWTSCRAVAVSDDAHGVVVLSEWDRRIRVLRLPARDYRAPWSYARPTGIDELKRREQDFRGLLDRAATLLERRQPAAAAEVLRRARSVPGFDEHPDLRHLSAVVGEHGTRTDLLSVWHRWNLTGTWLFTPRFSAALSGDGEIAVTGGADGKLRIWELAMGECLGVFGEACPGHVHTIEMTEDARYVVTADYGGGAFLWDLSEGTRQVLLGDASRARSLATNQEYAAVGHESGAVCVWEFRRARHRRTVLAHDCPVRSVALSRDGRLLATQGAEDGVARLWERATGRKLLDLPAAYPPGILRFGAEGRMLFVSGEAGLTAWNPRTGREVFSVESWRYDTFAVSADGTTAATCGALRELVVWDTATGRTLRRLPVGERTFVLGDTETTLASTGDAIALNSNGRYVVAAVRETIEVWNVRTGQRVHVLEGHLDDVAWLRFTEDDRRLLSADLGRVLRLWELDWDYEFEADA